MNDAAPHDIEREAGPPPPHPASSFHELNAVDALKTYLLGRIPGFKLPDAESWEEEAGRLRRTMLDEVVLKGIPDDWRTAGAEVEWKDVIETGKGYRIRKLTYQALPGLVIPALLYEPDHLPEMTPGVLNLNGHVGPPGKAVDYKQVRCVNLARRGMVAMNPEWLCFGELQGPGYQHNNASYLDLCGIAGIAVFYLAMSRALDVLLAHDHVDPGRIAVTGLSGGGWQTIVLGALDTRVRLAVPNAGYISLDCRVHHRADRGDIEQNAADLAATADYPLLTAMLAPRPALLLYNEHDDCCFRTARAKPSVFDPVQPLYASLGRRDAFEFHNNVVPGTHNYEQEHRERFYRFLNRHFLHGGQGRDEEIPSEDEIRTEEELTVGTPVGNADFVTLARSVADGLKREKPPREASALSRWQRVGRERLQSILRYRSVPVDAVTTISSKIDNGVRKTCFHYRLRQDWILPVAVSSPLARTTGKTHVILTDEGMNGAGTLTEEALRKGASAVAVEVIMQGACGLGKAPHQWTMMLSSSGGRMLGLQVAQLAAVMNRVETPRLGVTASGPVSCVIALMAAVTSDREVEEVALYRGLESLRLLIDEPGRYEAMSSLFCFGLLASFDIEELVALAHPARVELKSVAGL